MYDILQGFSSWPNFVSNVFDHPTWGVAGDVMSIARFSFPFFPLSAKLRRTGGKQLYPLAATFLLLRLLLLLLLLLLFNLLLLLLLLILSLLPLLHTILFLFKLLLHACFCSCCSSTGCNITVKEPLLNTGTLVLFLTSPTFWCFSF